MSLPRYHCATPLLPLMSFVFLLLHFSSFFPFVFSMKMNIKFHRRESNPGRKRERLACYQLHHNGLLMIYLLCFHLPCLPPSFYYLHFLNPLFLYIWLDSPSFFTFVSSLPPLPFHVTIPLSFVHFFFVPYILLLCVMAISLLSFLRVVFVYFIYYATGFMV